MVETWRRLPLKRTSRAPCSEKRISNLTCRSSILAPGTFSTNWTQLAGSVSLSTIVPGNSSGSQLRQFFRSHDAQDSARRPKEIKKKQAVTKDITDKIY